MTKTCSFCGNKNTEAAVVQYVYKHDGKFLIVNGVPCERCEFCGERYFQAKVLKRIEQSFLNVHSRGKRATRSMVVPVERFA